MLVLFLEFAYKTEGFFILNYNIYSSLMVRFLFHVKAALLSDIIASRVFQI